MIPAPISYDAIVLGAGAAGLMCAIEAGIRGRRILLLEHNETVGKKIRISGGGRCNFTNLHTDPRCFLSANPLFCTSALARYTPADFINYIDRHDIPYHEKKLGQLFCDGSAQAVIDALLRDCAAASVDIRTACSIGEIQKSDLFTITTSQGTFHAPALVVATGGLSIPKLGATDLGYRIARQFGLRIIACAPGLVPLTLPKSDLHHLADLSGVSFPARVSLGPTTFDENVLITHRGFSGPAILQISSYWDASKPPIKRNLNRNRLSTAIYEDNDTPSISIDLFPDLPLEELLMDTRRDSPATLPASALTGNLPARLAQRLCQMYDWNQPLGQMSNAAIRAMARALHQWEITPAGTEGYAKAEVTRGGVDTAALSPKTMEAREVPGLYFIGEVVDVTGWLGGYNFQWAWASAVAAARAL